MTIHQLPKPCFILDPNPWDRDEGLQHYPTRAEADEALRERREELGPDPRDLATIETCRVRQLDAACWDAQCTECGDYLENEDEGWIVHASSLPELYQSLDAYDWRLCPGEVFCPDDAPECSTVPPVTAAEQEDAGQLVIPGVIP